MTDSKENISASYPKIPVLAEYPYGSLEDRVKIIYLTRIPCKGEKLWGKKLWGTEHEYLEVGNVTHLDLKSEQGWLCKGEYAIAKITLLEIISLVAEDDSDDFITAITS